MKKHKGKICIIGAPSNLGGADTELKMAMEIWKSLGVEVHLIHPGDYSPTSLPMVEETKAAGHIVHKNKDWAKIDGMPCISYCSGEALKQLKEIRKHTDTFIFVNCMTWIFDSERMLVKEGLITHELYQREQVMNKSMKELITLNPNLKSKVVKPYFDSSSIKFDPERNFDKFVVGRISREDQGKYHRFTNNLMEGFVSPKMKSGIFLGFNKNIEKKIGKVSEWVKTYPAGGIKADDFYSKVNAIVQPCDPGHTENLPRISFEAMAAGVILIVDNKGGFQDQVIDGKTGWLCSDYREYVYKTSRCAFEPKERMDMAHEARAYLDENWGQKACEDGWGEYFKEIGVL